MTLYAGYGQADITPSLPHMLNGFAARQQPALSIAAPVRARVTVLRHGRRRAVIAVCDVLGFRIADSMRLEAAIGKVVGCSAKNVFLSCTHTHSGPMSQPLGLGFDFDPAYIDFVEQQLLTATRTAMADAEAVTSSCVGSVDVSEMGMYRWNVPEPGREHWPGRLSAWQLRRVGRGSLTFWHLGVHQYLLGWQSRVMHPDYPGSTCEAIERTLGGHAIFLPGCAGDVAPVPEMLTDLAGVNAYGQRAAEAAVRALHDGVEIKDAPLRYAHLAPHVYFNHEPKLAELYADNRPFTDAADKGYRNTRRWTDERRAGRLPTSSPFPMRVLRVGGVTLLGMPAEIFCETGLDLIRAMPGTHLLAVAHTGGNLGYLCREFAYRHDTYEANAHQWYDTAGAMPPSTEPRLRKAIVQAAQGLLAREDQVSG
jgi:hypothetical protein